MVAESFCKEMFFTNRIPDESAERLVCAIITDAVYRYSRALIHLKEYEKAETKKGKEIFRFAGYTVDEIETFFRPNWFDTLSIHINLNISGEQIIRMIKKTPKKFCNEHGGRRKKSYAAY